MKTQIAEIIAAKKECGENAHLWLQADAGDCILWETLKESENDDGSNAVDRWTLDAEEIKQLEETGEVDESN